MDTIDIEHKFTGNLFYELKEGVGGGGVKASVDPDVKYPCY